MDTALKSKFLGSMIGALMGDCLGEPYQFDRGVSKNVLRDSFSKLLNGESTRKYTFTDDTAMTVSLAKSLIEKGKLDPKDLAKRFVDEYFQHPKRGYGDHVVHVFEALRDSEFQDVFLPATKQFNGNGSYGNGSAMRISPLALFGSSKGLGYLEDSVKESSQITHAHPYGYHGAILQAFAIHDALKLNSEDKFDAVDYISQLETKMKEIEKEDLTYCRSLKRIKDIFVKKEERELFSDEIADYIGNNVTAQRSVPTAIYCFLRGMQPIEKFECSNPFVRTLYFAVSVGGATNTIASMAGSIAGAYYGEEIIPKDLMELCESIEEVKDLAEKLYEVAHKQEL